MLHKKLNGSKVIFLRVTLFSCRLINNTKPNLPKQVIFLIIAFSHLRFFSDIKHKVHLLYYLVHIYKNIIKTLFALIISLITE